MKKKLLTFVILMSSIAFSFGQTENKANNINRGMPNRISMNVTVPKQTQGATFGEKVNAGIVNGVCVIIFPNKQAFSVNSDGNKITPLTTAEVSKVNAGLHAAGGALSQGASLLGGALPGGAIISASVSKADGGRTIWEIKDSNSGFLLPSSLTDGEYVLTVKVSSDLKDTMKTQVRFGILVEGRFYKVITANSQANNILK
jgi:hypothetical protein